MRALSRRLQNRRQMFVGLKARDLFRYGRNYRNSAITAPRFVDANTSTLIRRQLQRRGADARPPALPDS